MKVGRRRRDRVDVKTGFWEGILLCQSSYTLYTEIWSKALSLSCNRRI